MLHKKSKKLILQFLSIVKIRILSSIFSSGYSSNFIFRILVLF